MPLEGEDSFSFLLNRAFNANYNPDLAQSEVNRPHEPIAPPFQFYDRHIGSNFSLRNIVHFPTIPHLLSETCNVAVKGFVENGYRFSASVDYHHGKEIPQVRFKDASKVREYYINHIGATSQAYLSKLCIHPHDENWLSVFEFRKHSENDTYYMAEGHLGVCEDPSGGIFIKDRLELPQSTKDTLVALLNKFPRLAIWHLFPMIDTFNSIFQNVTKDAEYNWETSHTSGYHFVTHTTPPPDGKTLASKLHGRRTARKTSPGFRDRKSIAKASKFVTPPLLVQRKRYRPDFCHYLQRAWAQAAIYDTTFIILHCGRYERIGIRHRASQTLYLSGVIDTVNIADPRYRKLHIGLHIAILQDALERLKFVDEHDVTSNSIPKKRPPDSFKDPEFDQSNKRPRLHSSSNSVHESADKLLAHRKLALITLDYDAFCSSVPSSFMRLGESCVRDRPTEDTDWTKDVDKQTKFSDQEYFTLKLSSPLGNGAIGVVHPAHAEVMLPSGEILTSELVMKLAFSEEQQKRLKNEFEIYCRISRVDDIEGVLDVHGLFYNAESNVMGLLMADGGKTLRQREIERTGRFAEQVKTTVQEREAFIRALESIHRADIRHYDIRADNLTINSDGKVFVIDFDCAEWASPDSMQDEILRLNEVLEGKYEPRLRY